MIGGLGATIGGFIEAASGGGGGGSDPHFSNVVLLLGFEGTDGATTTTDESASAHAATFFGNAQIDTAQAKFGSSSLLLDGSGDYIRYVDSPDWHFGTGQFTVEGFFRFAATPTTALLIAQWAGSGTWALKFQSGALAFIDGNSHTSDPYTWSPTLNTWYHICADRDGSNVLRVYVDGVMVKSRAYAFDIGDTGDTLEIGSLLPAGVSGWDVNGWVDEVRITKGVARYGSDGGFTVPTAAYPRS